MTGGTVCPDALSADVARAESLRVLHVIPAVARRYGGPSEAVARICGSLPACGVDPFLVTTDADGPGRLAVAYGDWTDFRGIPTRFFERGWSEAFKWSAPLAAWLRRHTHEFQVVHIHAVFSHSSVAAADAARRAGVPYVVRPLGSLTGWALGRRRFLKTCLWHVGVGRMLRNAAVIHCTSRREKDDVERLIGRRTGHVIPLGVDLPVAAPAGEPTDADRAGGPYVLALGRLHPVKGLDLLISAFRQLADQPRFRHWSLVIAGDGEPEYVALLRRMAGTDAAPGKIRFEDWVSGDRKTRLLGGAALLAMPSHQENFGLAAFEALAHGVPVLVSDRIDLAETIQSAGAGWVSELTPDGLLRSLGDALQNGQARRDRGLVGQALVAGEYTWQAVGTRLAELYRETCRRTSGRP